MIEILYYIGITLFMVSTLFRLNEIEKKIKK